MRSSPLHIGFAGPFSDVNFGDYGMVVNNLYDLGRQHTYTLFAYDHGFVDRLANGYFASYHVNQVLVDPEWFTNVASLSERAVTALEILGAPDARSRLRAEVAKIDVLVINGGGYFNELWAMPHRQTRLLSIMAVALVADQMGKRIVFSANGFGPFGASETSFMAFFTSLRNAIFHCRDDVYSAGALRALGVDPSRIHSAPDDLHVLNRAFESGGELDFRPPATPYVVIETYMSTEYVTEHLENFRNFVHRMRAQHGMSTIFMPLHLGPGGVHQGELLAAEIPDIELVDITDHGYLPLQDARRILAGAALTITSRYHALVFSISSGTPTVSVTRDVAGDARYYYAKNAGFLRKALAGTSYDESDFIMDDYPSALKHAAEAFDQIVERQQECIDAGLTRNAEALTRSRSSLLTRIVAEEW